MTQVTESLKQLLAFRLMKNMGAAAFRNGLTAFGSVEGILGAKAKDWAGVEGLGKLSRRELDDPKHRLVVDREIETAARAGVEIIGFFDGRYPSLLKEIFDPPMILYVKGSLPDGSLTNLAVVGSRNASWQGLRLASEVSKELAGAGAVVVSGLARGIDSAAHRGALEAKGLTVAVLGNGLSTVYPPENKKLLNEIAACGAVVSEFPMSEPPKPMNFPMRNRLISGLSRAVLVVEAREKSGALITVDFALEQGRDVYVFPGQAGSKRAVGSNGLLKQGARPVTDAAEILRDFGLPRQKRFRPAAKHESALNPEEKKLLKVLKKAESLHVDEIIEKSPLSPQQTLTLLTTLSIKGAVLELPGKYFAWKEVVG